VLIRKKQLVINLEKIGGGVPERGEGATGGDDVSLHRQLLVPNLDGRELDANPAMHARMNTNTNMDDLACQLDGCSS